MLFGFNLTGFMTFIPAKSYELPLRPKVYVSHSILVKERFPVESVVVVAAYFGRPAPIVFDPTKVKPTFGTNEHDSVSLEMPNVLNLSIEKDVDVTCSAKTVAFGWVGVGFVCDIGYV